MQPFETDLIRRMIYGAFDQHALEHPERPVHPDAKGSIAKRAARMIYKEFRKRHPDAAAGGDSDRSSSARAADRR